MTQRGFLRRRGSTWTAYWQVDSSGGRRQRSKGGFATRKEAQAFLTSTLAALQSGRFSETTKVTLGEYLLERWLPGRSVSLRPSTFDAYRRSIERHIVPALGHMRLQHLSADQLDRLYADLLNCGLAPKTVRNLHTLVHKALHDAVRKNLVIRNVADAADPPRQPRPGDREMSTWTAEQLREFLHHISDRRLGAAYVLAATTGMRRGEVLGLRWTDIDLDARRLAVKHTILNVAYEVTPGTPKTSRGRRSIALDRESVRVLTAHRARQRIEREASRATFADDDLVFTRPDGRPVHPDSFSQTFDRTVRRLGLPKIRLHDLRHTHATLGLAAGIPVKLMSERLGHATASFTQDVYMHAVPALEQAAADQIAELVFGTPLEAPEQEPSRHARSAQPD